MTAPRALVVDDDPDIRLIAELALGRIGGFEVATAATGADALAAINGAGALPDVVVLDLVMPGIDGLAVLRAIRARPELDHLPVVLMTGRPPEEDDSFRALGAAGVIVKPFDPLRLSDLIRELAGVPRP